MNELFSVSKILEPKNLAMFFAICCVVTYAMTTITRPLLRAAIKNKDFRTFGIQLISCGFGAFVGYEMSSYATIGLWLGFGSGALNVVVVSYIKNRLKSEDAKNVNLTITSKPPTEPSSKPKDEDEFL